MAERKIRLHVDAGRRGRLLDALGHRRIRQSALSAIWFDTPGLLLARHGVALCLRNEDGRWVQGLEIGEGGATDRLGHEAPIAHDVAGAPRLDLDLHRDAKAGRQLRALLKRHEHP